MGNIYKSRDDISIENKSLVKSPVCFPMMEQKRSEVGIYSKRNPSFHCFLCQQTRRFAYLSHSGFLFHSTLQLNIGFLLSYPITFSIISKLILNYHNWKQVVHHLRVSCRFGIQIMQGKKNLALQKKKKTHQPLQFRLKQGWETCVLQLLLIYDSHQPQPLGQ